MSDGNIAERPAHWFKKGQSGNPGGMPKGMHEVRQLARQHTKLAIERLVYWARSNNARASVAAATALLDRGWGKPTQTLDVDGNATFTQNNMNANIPLFVINPISTATSFPYHETLPSPSRPALPDPV
jgi:hypothetical protein